MGLTLDERLSSWCKFVSTSFVLDLQFLSLGIFASRVCIFIPRKPQNFAPIINIITPATMLQIKCTGSPHSIGLQHGKTASLEISRSITFYASLFLKLSKLDWPAVTQLALKYQPYLSENWPQYVSEMEGVAEGAGVKYEDILALNVRTEIAFGAFSDGCTALSWKGESGSVLAQNWDWNNE